MIVKLVGKEMVLICCEFTSLENVRQKALADLAVEGEKMHFTNETGNHVVIGKSYLFEHSCMPHTCTQVISIY